jgi:hypothetical protein
MFKQTRLEHQKEVVELLRGGSIATNLIGAFGRSMKETRLTAWLGFLLAENPTPLMQLFGFAGKTLNIQLETRHEEGRSDILVETTAGKGIIEAKVGASSAHEQASRYPGKWRVVIAQSPPRRVARVSYINWETLAGHLRQEARKSSPTYRFLVSQFIAHLEEHHMIKKTESLEIYAREINEPVTLSLFMQGRIYGCSYDKNNKVSLTQYFAPHFGAKIARTQPGIFQGISYVARIDEVIYAEGWSQFETEVCERRGRAWWNSHSTLMGQLRGRKEWRWTECLPTTFLLLGEPRLAFNPPVKKEHLQAGKGWLSRRFLSFDELFDAWSK